MPYDANAVANFFLDVAKSEAKPLDQMKLQKLVYYANGWHLAIKSKPLIHEQVEAWRYGPVIPSLRDSFRQYGDQPIDSPASYVVPCRREMTSFDELEEVVPTIEQGNPADLGFVRTLLERVWQVYGKYTGIQLSNMTHEQGSPWDHVHQFYEGSIPKGTDIPEQVIRDYFVGLTKQKAANA